MSLRETANIYIKYGRVNYNEQQTENQAIQLKPNSAAVRTYQFQVPHGIYNISSKRAGLENPFGYGFITSVSITNS